MNVEPFIGPIMEINIFWSESTIYNLTLRADLRWLSVRFDKNKNVDIYWMIHALSWSLRRKQQNHAIFELCHAITQRTLHGICDIFCFRRSHACLLDTIRRGDAHDELNIPQILRSVSHSSQATPLGLPFDLFRCIRSPRPSSPLRSPPSLKRIEKKNQNFSLSLHA